VRHGREARRVFFSGRKHHKPRLSLKNNTAGVRECEDTNRTRVAGSRDGVESVAANTLELFRNGAAVFIDWLDEAGRTTGEAAALGAVSESDTGGVVVASQMNLYRCDH
jgi:hypothetical protein